MVCKLTELFIENVRHILGERSAYWLSKESGLAQSTISRVLNAEINPSLETIEALATALNTPPNALLMRNPKNPYKIPIDILERLESQPEVVYDSIRAVLAAVDTRLKKKK